MKSYFDNDALPCLDLLITLYCNIIVNEKKSRMLKYYIIKVFFPNYNLGIKEKMIWGKTDHRHLSLDKIDNMIHNTIIYSFLKIKIEILQHCTHTIKMSK